MTKVTNAIHQGDCIAEMAKLPGGCIDLVFADPPFNIGYDYDVYDDRKDSEQYIDWSRRWMGEVFRVLKPQGTFWLAIGDEYAAELKVLAQRDLGFTTRSWVIWYYTFGVNCKRKFNRSHAHLFHFVKNAESFTFNDTPIRVPSARQLVYGDARANPKGRLPDDTWILRPQDADQCFEADGDTWYFPRVAGTFKERAGFHGCQMPEQLLGRIIQVSSNEGDVVLDPFSGSGTTLAVAKKLNRKWLGFELSQEYRDRATDRLDMIQPGDPLTGSSQPLKSVPKTGEGRENGEKATKSSTRPKRKKFDSDGPALWEADETSTAPKPARVNALSLDNASITKILEAVHHVGVGGELLDLLADSRKIIEFHHACRSASLAGNERDWNQSLFDQQVRAQWNAERNTVLSNRKLEFDDRRFVAEMTLAKLQSELKISAEEIFIDPQHMKQFDAAAGAWSNAPTLELRRLVLRMWQDRRNRMQQFSLVEAKGERDKKRFSKATTVNFDEPLPFDTTRGLYLFRIGLERRAYIGIADNLLECLSKIVCKQTEVQWKKLARTLSICTISMPTASQDELVELADFWIDHYQPRWNLSDNGF